MKRISNYFVFVFLIQAMLFLSCEKDDANPALEGYAGGIFITNEGAFGNSNGSVSHFCIDSNRVVNNLFEKVNGRNPGDVLQSFGTEGNLGVIVVNNSQKIEVVDLETFESVGTITGFSYPRYFTGIGNGMGYLSNGNLAGEVYLIDLNMMEVADTIEIGMGPEQMARSGNYVFVANSGGWDFDNTVSVINTGTHEVEKVVEVGDIPVAAVTDANGDVWVLCRGKVVYDDTWTTIIEETDSRLVRIDGTTHEVVTSIVIGEQGDYFNPSWLSICPSGEELLFGEVEGLYMMEISSDEQPSAPLIEEEFSHALIESHTGNILALMVTDYSSAGRLHIYTAGGEKTGSFDVGIGPNGLYTNY